MAFYVPLGPRGMVFRFGTFVVGVIGAVVYWRHARLRPTVVMDLPDTMNVATAHGIQFGTTPNDPQGATTLSI